MSRAAVLLILACGLQEPDLQRLIEAAEKTSLTLPEFPAAVDRIDAKAVTPAFKHRYQVLRAQARILQALQVRLLALKGTSVEMPLPGSKPAAVRIVDVSGKGVRVARAEGGMQDLPWSGLDPEWSIAECRLGLAGEPEAALYAGLWLAKAARWEAAFKEFAGSDSDHPLVLEARRRGLDGLVKQAEAATAGKRWREAVERLASAEKAAADDPAVKAAREKLVQAVAEQAKDYSRKGSRKSMEEMIDFIVKHFPGREALITEIRDESRWITISDPKKFGLTSKDGLILLDVGDKRVQGAYCDVSGSFDGISVRIQFNKATKEAHGGPIWMGRDGRIHPWLIRDNPLLMVARLDEKSEKWQVWGEDPVAPAETYEIRALLDKGAVAVSVNGVEIFRKDVGETEIKTPGVQASHGRLYFDRFRLRKKS